MLTYWETLTAIQSNVPVNDSYAQLWGRKSQNNYTIVTYTGTLPAVLTGTKAGYLHRYKIYGNTVQTGTPTPENPIEPQECGERTENLFDKDSAIPNKQYDRNGNLIAPTEAGTWYASGLIEVEPNETYVRSKAGETIGNVINFYASDKTFQSRNTPGAGVPFTIPSTTKYISFAINADSNPIEIFMLTAGSAAPSSYIPYGYKLPLTSGSTPVDIYIGDDTLSTEEYVDSGTGKIYRMVGGVLTPTDPPIPFPQIPTSANSTTISWAGEGLAPSQVELEYQKKR